MVANIRLLQGKVVEDPDQRPKNVSKLIQELALEILSAEELGVAAAMEPNSANSNEVGVG